MCGSGIAYRGIAVVPANGHDDHVQRIGAVIAVSEELTQEQISHHESLRLV